ncbi:MAG: hypothetical protein HKN00_11125 [Flavobacteriaceae bacterium]|nr:hypothetical protein [Flavobacteriaceae bacterium]
MKNYYIFLLSLLFITQISAQTKCSEADSDVNYAYSHIKSSYDSNNISDLKYFAYRSYEALNRAKPILEACGCDPTLTVTIDGIELLKKVETAETYEDGRFYVKRARELSRKGIGALDSCNQISMEEEELLTLEMEQNKLKEKQLELEQQQQLLQRRLLEQKEKELVVQKEILITNYSAALNSNINSYKEALRNFECDLQIRTDIPDHSELLKYSSDQLKQYFSKAIKTASDHYLLKLENCLNSDELTTIDD